MTTFYTTAFAAEPRNPMNSVGKKYRSIPARAALVTASMANGDTLVLAGPFTYSQRIARILTPNVSPALTAAADAKLGFMTKDALGALKAIKSGGDAVLWNGVTLASALTTRDLLYSLNSSLDSTKNIGELLAQGADQEPANGVFLVLTFPTKPSVDGVLDLDVVVEEATSA